MFEALLSIGLIGRLVGNETGKVGSRRESIESQ